MKLTINGRLWIETETGARIGYGRVTLLENVEKTGSISLAAKKMKMSYRQAWEEIKEINNLTTHPIVIKTAGGAGGGGTKLTEQGKQIIKRFKEAEESFSNYLKMETKNSG